MSGDPRGGEIWRDTGVIDEGWRVNPHEALRRLFNLTIFPKTWVSKKEISEIVRDYLSEWTLPPSLREVERLTTLLALVSPVLRYGIPGHRIFTLGDIVLKGLKPQKNDALLQDKISLKEMTEAKK